MTLAEAGEIFAYWAENPPAHLMLQMLARLVGWAPRPASVAAVSIADIAAAAPPGLAVTRGGALGMPVPLDVDGMRTKNRERALAFVRRSFRK